MLSPEVWRFQPAETTFRTISCDLNQPNALAAVDKFYYNHLVSVVLPDSLRLPESLTESLVNCEYYKLIDISLENLVKKDFVENFIKKGILTGLSINRRIDCEDCVAITPSKKLILSLSKESYQSLGLEGKVSHFTKNTKSKYVVSIDLLDKHCVPGKKNYERIKLRLSTLKNFTLILSWQPPEDKICPSSVAKYFHSRGVAVKLCKPTQKTRIEYQVKVPTVNFDDIDEMPDFLEWLGMFSLGGDLENGASDAFLNTCMVPEPNEMIGQVKFLEWRGLFTPMQISELIKELRKYLQDTDKSWASLHVQGFSDSPTNWNENEHHFYTSGDNGYVVVLNNTDKCIVVVNQCSNKYYK